MIQLLFLLLFQAGDNQAGALSPDSGSYEPEIAMEAEPENGEQVVVNNSENKDRQENIETESGQKNEKPFVLPEVTVEGAKQPGKDDTADATHVSGEKLRASARTSTLEALSQQAADVYVSGRGAGVHGVSNGASGAIHVRGLGGSPNAQVLVVEDGVPDVQGIFGHPIPDAYVPFLIDEVRVVKGGDSTLYGSNALGGVILIENRWRREEGFELENDAAYGSFQTIKETATLLGRWGDWDLASAFHYFRTDGHRDNSGGYNMVGSLGLRWRITPDLKLTLKNKALHLEGGRRPWPRDTSEYGSLVQRLARQFVRLRLDYKHKWFDLRVLSYFNVGIHRLYDGFYSEDYMAGASTEFDIHLHDTVDLLLGFSAHVDRRRSHQSHYGRRRTGRRFGELCVL